MVIYVDTLFLVNMGMDGIVILLTGKLLRKRICIVRYVLAAMLGAAVVLLAILPVMRQSRWLSLVCNLGGCMVMAWIAYQESRIKEIVKDTLALYAVTFFLGGAIEALYSCTEFGYLIRVQPVGLIFLLISTGVATVLFFISYRSYKKWETQEELIYPLRLENREKSFYTKAFLDTGNSLYDPISRKPVMVVDISVIRELYGEEFYEKVKKCYQEQNFILPEGMEGICLIPYRTVAGKGLLFGITADIAYIKKGESYIKLRKPCLAISRERINRDGDCHILLQSEHIKE